MFVKVLARKRQEADAVVKLSVVRAQTLRPERDVARQVRSGSAARGRAWAVAFFLRTTTSGRRSFT